MAVRKVHGSVFSTATMRVLACLYEKELEFEFVPVDMKTGAHKKEPIISMNPFGQIPVLEDCGLTMFESRAITQHLAHSYPKQGTDLVFINDPKRMSTLAIWIEVESQQFDPHASKIAFEYTFKSMLGLGATNEQLVSELQEKLCKVLDVYEKRLAHNKYLSGDAFALADLHHLPVIHYLMGTPAKKLFEERPHVCKWVADISRRPAWAKVLEMQKQGA